jgi:ketosteroid isomerase-like protein
VGSAREQRLTRRCACGAEATEHHYQEAAMRAIGVVLAIFLAVAMPLPRAGAGAPPATPEQWVEAFWAAYASKDLAALEQLFSPSATIMNRPLQRGLADIGRALEGREEMRAQPRGELEVKESATGAYVRQRVALTFRRAEGGRPYRLLSVYDWVLVHDEGALRASMMTYRHEAEPDLPVGAVRITTHARDEGGRPGAPQTAFGPNEGICFVLASDQVQGGHQFMVVLYAPARRVLRSPVLFSLGPIDAPGPMDPVWTCITFRNAPAGSWIAAIESEGLERGRTTFTVRP